MSDSLPPLADLWKQLARRGLKTTGNKTELMARLQAALREEALQHQNGQQHQTAQGGGAPSYGMPGGDDPSGGAQLYREEDGGMVAHEREDGTRKRHRAEATSASSGAPAHALHAAPLPTATSPPKHLSYPSTHEYVDAGVEAVRHGMYLAHGAFYEPPPMQFVSLRIPGCGPDMAPGLPSSYYPNYPSHPRLYHPSGGMVWAGPAPLDAYARTTPPAAAYNHHYHSGGVSHLQVKEGAYDSVGGGGYMEYDVRGGAGGIYAEQHEVPHHTPSAAAAFTPSDMSESSLPSSAASQLLEPPQPASMHASDAVNASDITQVAPEEDDPDAGEVDVVGDLHHSSL